MENILSGIKKILVLGPHPDDMEFGCMGTVLKMMAQGSEVHYAVFSMCEKSVPSGLPPDAIKKELIDVCNELKIDDAHRHFFSYDVRTFPEFRQNILEDMVKLNVKLKPDLVFLPSSTDIHQDHQTIHNEGKRAFKFNMILGYEMPWNNFNFYSDLYVILSEEMVARKIHFVNMYKSQAHRVYSDPEFLKSILRIRGVQTKTNFAEAFEVIRLIS